MSHVHISQKVNGFFNVKSSKYYFHMKRKILTDFQICSSALLWKNKLKQSVHLCVRIQNGDEWTRSMTDNTHPKSKGYNGVLSKMNYL